MLWECQAATEVNFEGGTGRNSHKHSAGDISYANGFEYAWEVYHDQIAPLVGNMPYMVVEG